MALVRDEGPGVIQIALQRSSYVAGEVVHGTISLCIYVPVSAQCK
jgi:hypothetical protein